LKKKSKKDWNRSVDDEEGLKRDLTKYKLARDLPDCGEGSEAKLLLELDMEKGNHKTTKPRFLRASRDE
jgi:hypothetical protein